MAGSGSKDKRREGKSQFGEGLSGPALKEGILEELKKKLEESDLGTPEEEVVRSFEEMIAVLPEGRLRDIFEAMRKPVEFSGKTANIVPGAQDWLWKIIRPLLAVEVPWIMLIPGDINSKLQAGLLRTIGRLEVGGLKGAVSIAKKIEQIRDRGGSGEEMVKAVMEAADPGEVINGILD